MDDTTENPARIAVSRPRNERGATIVLVAASIAALMAMVALAVDIGMLLTARSEAQRAADAAALAGAGELIFEPDNVDGAKQTAILFGDRNDVGGTPAGIQPEDVDVDLAEGRVTVTVFRTADRGSAMPTWFARLFGVDEVDVSARAAARVGSTNAARCLKPWTIPDAWNDANDNGVFDEGDTYEPGVHGYGSDWRNGVASDNGIDPAGTTYVKDRGRPIVLKPGDPKEANQPGWYFPWDVPQADGSPAVGGDKYRWNIANCNETVVFLGEEYMIENGNMIGPTKQGVGNLIDQDPDAVWVDGPNGPTDGTVEGSIFEENWEASPRVVTVPLYDPSFPIDPGKQPVVFNNFVGFFIEGMQGNDVIGRFLSVSGIGEGGEPAPGTVIQFVQLVE